MEGIHYCAGDRTNLRKCSLCSSRMAKLPMYQQYYIDQLVYFVHTEVGSA